MYYPELDSRVIYAEPGPPMAGDYDVFVFKNIDPATEAGRIFIDLERLGYRVHSIRNAMNATTRRSAPIFFVELVKGPFNATVLGLKRIANQNVLVETYLYSKSELMWCTICQGLDHLAEDCSSFPICAWCSGPHMTRHCTIGSDFPPFCCRCGGQHPSCYKGCNIYRQRAFEAKVRRFQKLSYLNVPPEELIRQALEEEPMMAQSEGSASLVSSGDSRVGVDSEMEYSLIRAISYTQDTIQHELVKKHLKVTLEHFLSMRYEWRPKILRLSFEVDSNETILS